MSHRIAGRKVDSAESLAIHLVAVAAIALVSAFTKALSGFGLALVAMPLFAATIGIRAAAPLGSLLGFLSNAYLLIRHRRALMIREIWRLVVAALLAIPLGVWSLGHADEEIVLGMLGVMLIAYSLYAWFSPRLPEIRNQNWAFLFGFVAGLLRGAYNTDGPPIVVYGSFRRWDPSEFRGNLQAFFICTTSTVLVTHALNRNYTTTILWYLLAALPFMLLGLWLGARMDRYLDPERFRKLVLVLLVAIGVKLIL